MFVDDREEWAGKHPGGRLGIGSVHMMLQGNQVARAVQQATFVAPETNSRLEGFIIMFALPRISQDGKGFP